MKFFIRINKLIVLGVVLMLAVIKPQNVLATTEGASGPVNTYTEVYSEEEVENEIDKDIQRILLEKSKASSTENSLFSVPEYDRYDHVKIESKNVSGEGYAGNQPAGGMRFPTGGGFYWSNSGGPSVSPSISFGNQVVSIGISLGNRATSGGYFVTAPNKTNYFKLRTRKTYRVTKTAVYGYYTGTNTRKFLYYIYPKALQSQSAWAVRQ